jgi:hypothetical protein
LVFGKTSRPASSLAPNATSEHRFDRMPSPTLSVAITLAENAEEINRWRNALPEKQSAIDSIPKRLKRWRSATQADDPCRPRDKPAATDLKQMP